MKYNRANLQDTISAAHRLASKQGGTLYVFATAYGFTIDDHAPPFHQAHWSVSAEEARCFLPVYGNTGTTLHLERTVTLQAGMNYADHGTQRWEG